MKKRVLLAGLTGLFMLVALDVPAAECTPGLTAPGGRAPLASGSESGESLAGASMAACAAEKAFHIPAAVPLFLSAIAGLGIVAFRGKPF